MSQSLRDRIVLSEYNAQRTRTQRRKELAVKWGKRLLILALIVLASLLVWLDRRNLILAHEQDLEMTRRIVYTPRLPTVRMDCGLSRIERDRMCRARERMTPIRSQS